MGKMFRVSIVFLFTAVASFGQVSIETFTNDYGRYFHGAKPTKEILQHANDYRFVFVSGFLHDFNGGGFGQPAEALQEFGVEEKHISCAHPSSQRSIAENAPLLFKELEWEYWKDPSKRLILIAHSKGAVELLAMAATHPDFIEFAVKQMYLVQGPFSGSRIADFIVDEGNGFSRRFPAWERTVLEIVRDSRIYLEELLDFRVDEGLYSITSKRSVDFWSRMQNHHADGFKAVSDKVFYVKSSQVPKYATFHLQPFANYIFTSYGEANDGLVSLSSQSLDWVGKTVAELAGDHISFFATATSEDPYAYRRGLMGAIVKNALIDGK